MKQLIRFLALTLFLLAGCGTEGPTFGTGVDTTPDETPVEAISATAVKVSPPALDTLGNRDTALSSQFPDEFPAYSVKLSNFRIQDVEVSYAQAFALLGRACSLKTDTAVKNAEGTFDTVAVVLKRDSGFSLNSKGDTLKYNGNPVLFIDTLFLKGQTVSQKTTLVDSVVLTTANYISWELLDRNQNHPVTRVSWEGAALFCNLKSDQEKLGRCYDSAFVLDISKSGYRLPTEAEWETAARGGISADSAFYPTGTSISENKARFAYNLFPASLVPVKSYEPNAYGLYDLGGNAWEWCQDYFASGYYTSLAGSAPVSDPYNNAPDSSGTLRSVRGGSAADHPLELRVTNRGFLAPARLDPYVGFRMVRAN